MMKNNNIPNIPAEKFKFVGVDAKLHDQKFETKQISYFRDAFNRFCKNKSSVVAAYIILLLVLFAIFSPMISIYNVKHMDKMYTNTPPFVRSVAEMSIGVLDGGVTRDSQNDASMDYWRGIAEETGMTKKDVATVVDATFDKITAAMVDGKALKDVVNE